MCLSSLSMEPFRHSAINYGRLPSYSTCSVTTTPYSTSTLGPYDPESEEELDSSECLERLDKLLLLEDDELLSGDEGLEELGSY